MSLWKACVNNNSEIVTDKDFDPFASDYKNNGIYCLKIPFEYSTKGGHFNLSATFDASNAPDNIRCEIEFTNSAVMNHSTYGKKFNVSRTTIIGNQHKNIFTTGMSETCENVRMIPLNYGYDYYLLLHFFVPDSNNGLKTYVTTGTDWSVTLDFTFYNEDTI